MIAVICEDYSFSGNGVLALQHLKIKENKTKQNKTPKPLPFCMRIKSQREKKDRVMTEVNMIMG